MVFLPQLTNLFNIWYRFCFQSGTRWKGNTEGCIEFYCCFSFWVWIDLPCEKIFPPEPSLLTLLWHFWDLTANQWCLGSKEFWLQRENIQHWCVCWPGSLSCYFWLILTEETEGTRSPTSPSTHACNYSVIACPVVRACLIPAPSFSLYLKAGTTPWDTAMWVNPVKAIYRISTHRMKEKHYHC